MLNHLMLFSFSLAHIYTQTIKIFNSNASTIPPHLIYVNMKWGKLLFRSSYIESFDIVQYLSQLAENNRERPQAS